MFDICDRGTLIALLTDHLSGRVHLGTAHGRQASEEHVQVVRVHQPGHVAAKDLGDHAEQHHAFR